MTAKGARSSAPRPEAAPRFPVPLMHAAATLYYLQDATQADVARSLGVSRATVSRLLAEARRLGIVKIEVADLVEDDPQELGSRLASALGLHAVYVAPTTHQALVGPALAPQLANALNDVGLSQGDVLLVSSGRTVWEAAQATLPSFPGVIVTPSVGGRDEPEAWYQTNEITRLFAEKVGGRPVFLHAPALPSPDLHERLTHDPGIRGTLELWSRAKCAILGVGARPETRESMPSFVPRGADWLEAAVGDVCTRFFDEKGTPLAFPGSDRLISAGLDTLRQIPATVAVAVGETKIASLLAGAHGGWFNILVTDAATAAAMLAASADDQLPLEVNT
jgi:DNA-binding transcriptional regulator LsrR (DeoR family)